MEFSAVAPTQGPIADAVECIWVCRRPGATGRETVLPSGRAQLVFGLDEHHPVASILGSSTRPRSIEAGAQRFAVGVVLRPGGLRALTGCAASDFLDESVPIDEATTLDVSELTDRLRSATSNERCAHVVSAALDGQLASVGRPPSAEVRQAAQLLARGRSVGGASIDVGTMPRRLRDHFRNEVGMSPKTFARLQRFHASVRAVRSEAASDLAVIAVGHGYADQSHMTRDFAEFAGVTPGSVHRDGSRAPTHLDR